MTRNPLLQYPSHFREAPQRKSAYGGAVTEFWIDRENQRVGGTNWSMKTLDLPKGSPITAIVQIREGVLLQLDDEGNDSVWLSLFRRNSDQLTSSTHSLDEEGLAITVDRLRQPQGIAVVPLCSCGDRGCGNMGVQFSYSFSSSCVGRVIEYLKNLPDLDAPAERGLTVLHGYDELSDHPSQICQSS